LTNKEKPIIFSTEMVCAVLDGRKTQTRRVIKPHIPNRVITKAEYGNVLNLPGLHWKVQYNDTIPTYIDVVKPRYQPGDMSWKTTQKRILTWVWVYTFERVDTPQK
jgi:hypothetical protein